MSAPEVLWVLGAVVIGLPLLWAAAEHVASLPTCAHCGRRLHWLNLGWGCRTSREDFCERSG